MSPLRVVRVVLPIGLSFLPMLLAVLLTGQSAQEDRGFPHEPHEGLFPLCRGCHQGIETGDPLAGFPAPGSCAGCHDGVDVARVTWGGPTPELSTLSFDHQAHALEVSVDASEPLTCQACHASEVGRRMTVEPLQAGLCLSCHEGPGIDHTGAADCEACHVPLATSRLPRERIVALEVPSDHAGGSFVRTLHGKDLLNQPGRCATCHTRERCLACHVDAAREELALIPAAPAAMELPEAAVHYPVPATHGGPDFEIEHGALARATVGTRCATCHTKNDCASCHLSPLPAEVASLPALGSVAAPGVGLVYRAPASHDAPFFLRSHAAPAASDPAGCASCHTQPFCAECHQAAERPVFHDSDYVVRHAADAWGQRTECATCHNVQSFCRTCHLQAGFGAQARLGPGYHDAESLWLFRHGQSARQSLESCSSCHRQGECLQCHAQTGSFRINPHGPGFDGERAWEKNPVICTACHLSRPFGGEAR